MKFAVVEYSSKSGDVWKHTDKKPNYLADTEKEIDATSFGCYVSALEGEHVPLTGLIVGPVEEVNRTTVVRRKVYKRMFKKWPNNYSIDYLLKFNVLLAVHQLSDAHEMIRLVQRLKQRKPHMFIAGVPTQPYGILRDAVEQNKRDKQNLVNFMNACDLFIVVVKDTVEWYESMTQKPVVYVPQPYPVSYVSRFTVPRSEKDAHILIAGVTQRNNIKQGHIVARELQRLFPNHVITIPTVKGLEYDYTELEGTKYELFPFEQWHEHLKTLAKTKIVINTDYTHTRGRVQMDCASVGTPSLGGNSDGQKDLFPDLQSNDQTPIKEIIKKGIKLMKDDWYYDAVTINASEKLRKYDYEDSAARMYLLVKTYGSKK